MIFKYFACRWNVTAQSFPLGWVTSRAKYGFPESAGMSHKRLFCQLRSLNDVPFRASFIQVCLFVSELILLKLTFFYFRRRPKWLNSRAFLRAKNGGTEPQKLSVQFAPSQASPPDDFREMTCPSIFNVSTSFGEKKGRKWVLTIFALAVITIDAVFLLLCARTEVAECAWVMKK